MDNPITAEVQSSIPSHARQGCMAEMLLWWQGCISQHRPEGQKLSRDTDQGLRGAKPPSKQFWLTTEGAGG